MKKILIINQDPLTYRVYTGFCVEYFLEQGVSVTYLDLSNFYYPNLVMHNVLNKEFVVKINFLDEILNYLMTMIDFSETIIMLGANFVWKSRKIFYFLFQSNAFIVKVSIYANNMLSSSFFTKFNGKTFCDIWDVVFRKIYQCLFNVKIYKFIFSSSILSSDRIKINHPDYESYINSNIKSNNPPKHIVFLDEYFPLHPEILYWFKVDLSDVTQLYYSEMNTFFDFLEKKYKLPVVVAAHPKSSYKGNEYGGRKIIRDNTCELVHESLFVVMHQSTSMSYAILDYKPIAVVTCAEYKRLPRKIRWFQDQIANYFNLPIVDLDLEDYKTIDFMHINLSRFENYKYSFLTSPETQYLTNGEILYSKLVNIQLRKV